jgi:hypothetical protein
MTILAVAFLASPASAGPGRTHALPSLRAVASLPGSDTSASTTFSLNALHASDFRVLSRPSRRSVVLGYPRAKPCARTKVSLRLLVADADPKTHVRGALPSADQEGEEARATGPDFTSGSERVSAWRSAGDIQRSRTLVLDGIRARKVVKAGRPMLQELRFHGQTTDPRSRCVTANRLTIGPGFLDLLRLGG